eukprot:SAG11_NODE_29691_length_308_cov_0.889952_1_plen_65_part_01
MLLARSDARVRTRYSISATKRHSLRMCSASSRCAQIVETLVWRLERFAHEGRDECYRTAPSRPLA